MSDAVQAPQLVAQAFTLLSQDEYLSDRRATEGTGSAALCSEEEPGQRGVRLSVCFTHTARGQTQEDTWNKNKWSLCGMLIFLELKCGNGTMEDNPFSGLTNLPD